jgi:adenylate kinase family enzyme
MAAGKLVDDSIVLGMIRERLADPDVARGFILDGFPRNIAQAEALDEMLRQEGKPLTAVVQMEVPYAELTRRIAGRRSCQSCGRVYNIYSMPIGAALLLHLAAIAALVGLKNSAPPALPPIYKVNIVAAPLGPSAIGVVNPPKEAAEARAEAKR